MKKYIFILNAVELMSQLMVGKRLEGVLYIDEETGRLTFKAWNRKAPKHRPRGVLVHRMEHGWVKESPERWKVYESVPKNIGVAHVLNVLDRELNEAQTAIVETEIVDRV